MSGVHGLVTEYAVDGKVAGGLKATFLVGKFVEHLGRHGGGVRSKKVFKGLC